MYSYGCYLGFSIDMDFIPHWEIKEREMSKINISFVIYTLNLLFCPRELL